MEQQLAEKLRVYAQWLTERGLHQAPPLRQRADSDRSLAEVPPAITMPVKIAFLSKASSSATASHTLDREEEELLDKIALALKLTRDEYFVASVPLAETDGYKRIDVNQTNALLSRWSPKVIVVLGAESATEFFGGSNVFERARGKLQTFEFYPRTPILCTFHPRDLLADPQKKRLAWADLQAVVNLLES